MVTYYKMTQIIRLTVSVNQSDTLDASIKCNRPFINSSIIITDLSDISTMRTCVTNNVTCRITDKLHINGAPFNKGAAYKSVQKLLHRDTSMQGKYLLLLDADICIPRKWWVEILLNLPQTPHSLLSMTERCIFLLPSDVSKRRYKIKSLPNITTLGFFQLYKIDSNSPLYPSTFPTAAVSDKVFGNKFIRSKRISFGRAVHMGATHHWSGQAEKKQNWSSVVQHMPSEC